MTKKNKRETQEAVEAPEEITAPLAENEVPLAPEAPEPLQGEQLSAALTSRFSLLQKELNDLNGRIAINEKQVKDAQEFIDADRKVAESLSAKMSELRLIFSSVTPQPEQPQQAQA